MKFQILIPSSVASAYVLVGVLSSFVLDMTKAATYNAPVLPSPICITFDPILMKGDAEFVNTDSSSPSTVPTTGDFTIGEKYQAVTGQGVPNQSGGFVDISLEFKSVCVVTRDQPPLSSFASSPSCQYEFDMRFCRNSHINCRQGTFSAHGSGPDKIRIAGGADDFFGAFGQIATTSDFNPGTIQSNGDLKDSTVGLKIELCY